MDRLESFELLCQYVTPVDVQVHQPGNEAIFKNHDWETILKLADEYLVTPSLYLGLQRRGLLKHLGKDLRNHLAAIYLLNKDRNAKIKAQALSVIQLLNTTSVQPVLLKGIAGLLTGLYEDDGERFMCDIDLMVDQLELIKVVELLTANDYTCDPDIHEAVLCSSFHTHELSLMPNIGGVKIDLHVRPAGSGELKSFVSSAGARNQASKLVVETAIALLPSLKFRLMHNFYHAQHLHHSYLDGHIDLRQLIDWVYLWQLDRSTISYADIHDKLQQHWLGDSFALYVLTAEKLLKQSMPAELAPNYFVRLLFQRQLLQLNYLWFYRLSVLVAFLLRGMLLFSPERFRLLYGDLPLKKLLILIIKDLLNPSWYIIQLYQMRRLGLRFVR